jgi:hypothetical protein
MARLAKLSSKNQITLPVDILKGFPEIDYFRVGVEGDSIVLSPLRVEEGPSSLAEARKRFKEKGFDENTIAQAVRWARKNPK